MILEVVVETVEDALAAAAGGADQVEVKCDYLEYGLTPTRGMLAKICQGVSCPVLCMIRPHARSFLYSPHDVEVMVADIQDAKLLPVAGILTGCLAANNEIDLPTLQALKKAADPLDLHIHLAWELTPDPILTLQQFIGLGIKSVRISGGGRVSGQASENQGRIKKYYARFGKELDFYLAGGVTAENVFDLVTSTGVTNVHSGSGVREPQTRTGAVSESKVAALKLALARAAEKAQEQGM
jgi:copper homeostasis protein